MPPDYFEDKLPAFILHIEWFVFGKLLQLASSDDVLAVELEAPFSAGYS
jgi:hypothetical protein